MNTAIFNHIDEWISSGGKMSINGLRPVRKLHKNGLLSEKEWERIDSTVLEVTRQELVGVADLINAGMTEDLGGLGTIISTWERIGLLGPAEVSFTGTTRGERDRLEMDYDGVPVPIIFKDFELNLRFLLASQNKGQSLDLTTSRAATEEVARLQERILFNGSTKKLGTYSIYGYTTHPSRLTDTATNYGGGVFSVAGNAYKSIQGALAALRAKGARGPYMIYVASNNYTEMLNLYGSTDNTELGIILEKMPEILDIKVGWDLDPDELVIVTMNKKYVDLGVAEGIQALQWAELGGFLVQYRIFSAMVPRIKVDKKSNVGILHMTGL